MSAAHRGQVVSPEQRVKLSAALKGRKRSPETCAKISAGLKAKAKSKEHREKLQRSAITRWARWRAEKQEVV